MQNQDNQSSIIYFTLLMVIELLVFIFSLASNQKELMFFNILRIVMLVGSKCMESISWLIQYIIFVIICALFSFDPVGLWITGHGQVRTGPQNAFCVIIFVLLIIAIYMAYLFKKKFEKEIEENFVGQGYSNPNQGFHAYKPSNPNPGYFHQEEPKNQSHQPQPQGYGGNKRGFQQFSGQAYSLA